MGIMLNHTPVPARDKEASARLIKPVRAKSDRCGLVDVGRQIAGAFSQSDRADLPDVAAAPVRGSGSPPFVLAATSKPPAVMSQLNGVLASLITGAVLMLYVELRIRSRTRWTCGCDPIFRTLRNGRVRFTLDDLRNSQPPTADKHPQHRGQEGRVPVPDPDHDSTIPDLPHHPGPPRHRRTSGVADE